METLQILVVDDEPGMRMGVLRALRDFHVPMADVAQEIQFSLDQACSGEEAMEKIAVAAPDILLLDHKLPGMSGLDVLSRTADKANGMLTIMITAYASLETAITATKRGAYDFLAKPFTPEELRASIRKAAKHVVLQRQARKLAEEKHRVRFQFISVLAHELKAPLGAIQGYLSILRDHSAGNDPAMYDHMIQRSLVRLEGMRKLIMDLLDMTRLESGQRKRDRVDVDVLDVAKASIEMQANDAAANGVAVRLHAEGPVVMQADRGEIEIVLNNLLSNAIKYNRPQGTVDATLTADEQFVTIKVADTGIGMTAEETGRLFNDFVRIKNEKTRNIMGSGLGLSIVKKLALVYGGEALVASEPGVGTTFTVTLRRTPPALPAA